MRNGRSEFKRAEFKARMRLSLTDLRPSPPIMKNILWVESCWHSLRCTLARKQLFKPLYQNKIGTYALADFRRPLYSQRRFYLESNRERTLSVRRHICLYG
ncbi:uncharacterized protein PHALS_13399 [Plasmopara halstedii]|uniref:Uncharacterized protein n=1 Tax=Plasmopara halstedii TaxID=4781 RepID=A0A0P1AQ18_PLAHL|nr:uncharacterized protein PHALS_13399 [Plasmopara halstedii]CEG43185.1 hypothetical protein PHALS_13399 [Plasmopara halstedii]|eukprot:XP_024579554.1 hypothetical protein PHALS_13399 [Plasmopara halstedii]